jgi:hypothetical protein
MFGSGEKKKLRPKNSGKSDPLPEGDAGYDPLSKEETDDLPISPIEEDRMAKENSKVGKKEPNEENIVYDWMTGEEIGLVKNVVTNEKGSVISYEVKSLAGNIMQYSTSQIDVTNEGYILLPIWLSKGREHRDRLSDASRKLTELRKMVDSNTISIETYTEMAKVTFNIDLLEGCEQSMGEIDSMLLNVRTEKSRIEQEIYSLDIKRRVGLIDRVAYSKNAIELTDAYKRILYHVSEVETLKKELTKVFSESRKMEEVPGENLEALRDRKYRLHFVLSSIPMSSVKVEKLEE